MNGGKRYREATAKVDRDRSYLPGEAIRLIKDLPAANYKALLRYYYGDNLEGLIAVKFQYDRDNRLAFELGIPPS